MKLQENNAELDAQAAELAELLDSLVAGGTAHINLQVGEETMVQTINSTDCSGKLGACAMPTFLDEENAEEADEEDF